ncbi:MAG: SDR family NAD(P)-dependent oxidoreductase [Candidatus Nanopelagicales bacterium]
MDPDRVLDDVPDDALEGRVALVTGGSRGIGLAAAREMGRRGATVVLVGQDPGRAQGTAAALVAEGVDAVGHGCDVADADAVERLRDRLGPLAEPDVIVCAAGVMSGRMSKTLRTDPHEWRRVLGVNLDGVQHVVAAFAPPMVARRDGRIVTVSACLGRMSGPGTSGGLAPYRVSKAAVNAWTRNLAAELGAGTRGVLVDATCPAHCRTDMGGADAPRSAEQGAATAVWLAARRATGADGAPVPTGLLWEDREVVPW